MHYLLFKRLGKMQLIKYYIHLQIILLCTYLYKICVYLPELFTKIFLIRVIYCQYRFFTVLRIQLLRR